jgi:hypothetical protein
VEWLGGFGKIVPGKEHVDLAIVAEGTCRRIVLQQLDALEGPARKVNGKG